MGIFSRAKRHPDPTDGRADFAGNNSDTPLSIHDPRLPVEVREHALRFGENHVSLHRMQTDQGIEWWLLDREGELLDAFSFKSNG